MTSGRLVAVPLRPGPLVPVEQEDDVDELLDELLGAETDEAPGATDIALVALGLILTIGGLVTASRAIAVVGAALLVIGLALPLRAAWRALRRRRRTRNAAVLRIDTNSTSQLVAAYEELRAASQSRAAAGDGVRAAHAAVLEVATLLEGQAPSTDELPYVEQRTEAILRLTAVVRSSPSDPARAALVEARAEVDRLAGSSTLHELEAVRRRFADDAPS